MSSNLILLLSLVFNFNEAAGQDLETALAIVDTAVKDGSIPGASVLIMRNGELLVQRAFGVCEVAPTERAFELDTICWIASLTKPVTATAAMKLVEDGRLKLDSPIEEYLPQFDKLQTKDGHQHSVTIRQLMSHASGIPASVPLRESYFFTQGWYDQKLENVVRAIARRPLDFEPGTQVHYSNAAPYVLGRIIETSSGKPFGEFVQTEVLQPLQMQDTGFSIPAENVDRAAVVYRREQETLSEYCRYDPSWRVNMTMPDGGLFSTAADMARFANHFLQQENQTQVLNTASIQLMLTEQSDGYGLGWILDREHQFSHWGSSGTLMWADRETGVVGVFFSQIQDFRLLEDLRERFRTAVDSALSLR